MRLEFVVVPQLFLRVFTWILELLLNSKHRSTHQIYKRVSRSRTLNVYLAIGTFFSVIIFKSHIDMKEFRALQFK